MTTESEVATAEKTRPVGSSAIPSAAALRLSEETLLALVRFDEKGLVTAVVQEATSGAVLMVAYMNRDALDKTVSTGRSWFYSRSRGALWCKGETSGDRQYVRELRVDCDGDALVLVVDQHGDGACHTKHPTCFYRLLASGPGNPAGHEHA